MVLLTVNGAWADEAIPISDHFDGKRFHNLQKTEAKSLWDLLKWRFQRTAPVEDLMPTAKVLETPKVKNETNDIALTWVGHATFLVQANGMNVLTDPIWSDRCSPVSFIGPKRVHEPGIRFEKLPPIHAVVISHNHYDHMDIDTLVKLWQRDRPVFIVPLKNRKTLASAGIGNIVEQDWWSSTALNNGLTITATPAHHWSGRWVIDRNEALWAGYVLRFGEKNVFFAGDTGFSPHFSAIKNRFGNFEIALLPIGAHLPRWFMKDSHLSPADALDAAAILDARHTIPMHFGTFALGDDGFTLAEKELRTLVAGRAIRLNVLAVGETFQGNTPTIAAQN